MGAMSKRKGVKGELELSHELRRVLGVSARRGQQYSGSPESPDIVHSIPGVHIECKRVEKLQLTQALDQAVADAGTDVPVVMSRRNRQPWLVTVRLDDLPAFVTQVYLTMSSDIDGGEE
jgi:hypothetical protein